MKRLGRLAAVAGLLVSAWLVWHDHPGAVLALLRVAGAGLLVAGLAHVVPMVINAHAWQTLIRGRNRPTLAGMLHLVWIRESVNGLLPVARIGGEVAAFRLLRARRIGASTAIASMVVDTQLMLIGQLLFTVFGIGFLLTQSSSGGLQLAGHLLWGLAGLAPCLVLFVLLQHLNPFSRITRSLNHATGGKLASLLGASADIDRRIRFVWRRRGVVIRYILVWQPLQCGATAVELWLALHFMGIALGLVDAVVFESLIQAVSSAAFFVPGGLGVQEGGFVLIGGALGLPPDACLALAGARRVRDLLIYVPGLLAWQVAESWHAAPVTAPVAPA